MVKKLTIAVFILAVILLAVGYANVHWVIITYGFAFLGLSIIGLIWCLKK